MYDARFGLRDFMIEDIHRVTAQSLPANIDLATASFPCIDLSLAGNRAGLAGEHAGDSAAGGGRIKVRRMCRIAHRPPIGCPAALPPRPR